MKIMVEVKKEHYACSVPKAIDGCAIHNALGPFVDKQGKILKMDF